MIFLCVCVSVRAWRTMEYEENDEKKKKKVKTQRRINKIKNWKPVDAVLCAHSAACGIRLTVNATCEARCCVWVCARVNTVRCTNTMIVFNLNRFRSVEITHFRCRIRTHQHKQRVTFSSLSLSQIVSISVYLDLWEIFRCVDRNLAHKHSSSMSAIAYLKWMEPGRNVMFSVDFVRSIYSVDFSRFVLCVLCREKSQCCCCFVPFWADGWRKGFEKY